VVIGDDLGKAGQTRLQAEERVRSLGLSERFRFLGFRRDAARLLQLFDVVAMPSHTEPLGLSALEGMAAGRPVVGSRIGGIMETVVEGDTGILVPPRDAIHLAEALETVVSDPSLRTRFGQAGRQRVDAEFSAETHAGRVQAMYDDLLGITREHPQSGEGIGTSRLREAPQS
jgi:glycosyltransferase involved in cell wall biosynthesis